MIDSLSTHFYIAVTFHLILTVDIDKKKVFYSRNCGGCACASLKYLV